MYRIKKNVIYETEIKKSKFICYLRRVEDEDSLKAFILEIKKQHPKATHHCQAAFINDQLQRSNDDGEPAGTAGIPMLEVLRKRDIELVAAVVVRYYGGIQLGAGGLIRAYSGAVADALHSSDLYEVTHINKYEVEVSYSHADRIEHLLSANIINKCYLETVTFTYSSNDESLPARIAEITSGQSTPLFIANEELEILVEEELS